MSQRKFTTIWAIIPVAVAVFYYVLDAPTTLDLAAIHFPFDDPNTLADIPTKFRQLDGKRVAVRGYMVPMNEAVEIRQFAIVATMPGGTGWGPPPQVCQLADCTSPAPVNYTWDPIRATGALHVAVLRDEGFVVSVFQLDVDHLSPSPEETARWPWAVIGGIAVLCGGFWFRRWYLRRRLRVAGLCPVCGYDVRANTLRCSECGTQLF